jgi:hypothetical protein
MLWIVYIGRDGQQVEIAVVVLRLASCLLCIILAAAEAGEHGSVLWPSQQQLHRSARS